MMASRGTSVYAISDGEVENPSTGGWDTDGVGNVVGMRVKHKTIDGRTFHAIYGRNLQKSLLVHKSKLVIA